MDPQLYDLIEPTVIFATLLGTAFGVKLLIWGKGPIRGLRRPPEQDGLEQRVAELEERCEQWSELAARQADQLEDLHERLEFTERMLTRQRSETPQALRNPDSPTTL